jgi:hypothetical protein
LRGTQTGAPFAFVKGTEPYQLEAFEMSTEPNATPGQVAPVTPGEAPAQSAEPTGQEGAKPEFLTRAEAEKLREDILKETRSYADKGRVRVEKAVSEVTKAVETLRAHGQVVTPEQEKALKDEATRKAITEPEPQAAPQGQPQVDPEIVTIQKNAGVDLYDGDPELATLDRDHGILAFYKSVEAAALAKKARLASTPEPTNPNPRLPPAGSPPSGNFNPAMTADDMWERVRHKH